MATSSGTDTAKPLTGNSTGDMYYATDTGVWYRALSATQWVVDTPNSNGAIGVEAIANAKVTPATTYASTITWTGTTAPSGTTNHSYRWVRIGTMVTLNISLVYGTAGSALTQVTMALPSDCPAPKEPAGLTAASTLQYPGAGYLSTGPTAAGVASRVFMLANSGDNGYNIIIVAGSTNARVGQATVTYFTA